MLASIMSCSITSPLIYFSSSEIFSLTSGVNTGDDNTLQKHLNIFPTSSKSYDLIIFPNVYKINFLKFLSSLNFLSNL